MWISCSWLCPLLRPCRTDRVPKPRLDLLCVVRRSREKNQQRRYRFSHFFDIVNSAKRRDSGVMPPAGLQPLSGEVVDASTAAVALNLAAIGVATSTIAAGVCATSVSSVKRIQRYTAQHGGGARVPRMGKGKQLASSVTDAVGHVPRASRCVCMRYRVHR